MVTADHFWWSDEPSHNTDLHHPHEKAPHCLPCHWTQPDEQQSLRAVDSYLPFAPYTGCPCTAEQICRHDSRPLYQASCDTQLHPLPVRWDFAHEPLPETQSLGSNHFLDVACCMAGDASSHAVLHSKCSLSVFKTAMMQHFCVHSLLGALHAAHGLIGAALHICCQVTLVCML